MIFINVCELQTLAEINGSMASNATLPSAIRKTVADILKISEKNISMPVILFDEVEKSLGSPMVLVNNATYSTQTSIFDITTDEIDKHYFVNLRATTLLCAEFVKRFRGDKNGRIINITSGQSLSVMSNEVAYAITKGAIETLTKTIYQDLATKGITINAVNPGLTDTGWMDEEQESIFKDRFPMGRFGQPEDAARLIAFLANENAEWITGQIIHSEGGFIRERY